MDLHSKFQIPTFQRQSFVRATFLTRITKSVCTDSMGVHNTEYKLLKTMLDIPVVEFPWWPEGVNKASRADWLGKVKTCAHQECQLLYMATTRAHMFSGKESWSIQLNRKGKMKVHWGIYFFWVLTLFDFHHDM